MEAAVIRSVGGGTKPHVPIHPFRRRFGGKCAFGGRAADGDVGGNHLAEHAVSDELDGRYEFAAVGRTLLHTGLEDAACAADFVDDVTRLADGQRQRFFAVDVFTSVGGHDGHRGMPVVRRANDDSIKIWSGQHVSEITIFGATFVLAGLLLVGVSLLRQIVGVFHLARIDVADGDDLDGRHFKQVSQMAGGHAASADDADGDAVVGGRGKDFGHGNKRRRGRGGSKSFKE